MGGIVAKYIPLLDTYVNGTIQNIITLSTPHKDPPFALSRSLKSFYTTLKSTWKTSHSSPNSTIAMTCVAGGTRDTVLDSSLTYVYDSCDPSKTTSVFSCNYLPCFLD